MTYRSTGIHDYGGAFVMEGWLTLHGITRFVPLELGRAPAPPARRGDAQHVFRATGSINRGDFIPHPRRPPGHTVPLSEEIQIKLALKTRPCTR
jgi:polyisoprenoid-binding protein YceI